VTQSTLNTLFQPALDKIADHYCKLPDGAREQELLFGKATLEEEWDCARREYIATARRNAPRLLLEKNTVSQREIDESNKLKRASAPVVFKPVARLDTEDMLQYILGNTEVLKPYPVLTVLAATLVTSLYSQARLEAMFNQLKMMLTAKRAALAPAKVDMQMAIKCNGPSSTAGMRSGLTRKWLLETAYKVFVSAEAARKITKAQRKHVYANDLVGVKPRSDFGRCPDLTEGAADSIQAVMDKAEAAKKRKETAVALASEPAREQLEEGLAGEAAILNGPVEQVDLVQDGGSTFIKVMGSGGGLSLRSPILDIESSEPQIADEVAVTGFAGNVWFNGTVVSTKQARGKQVFVVVFPFDGSISDLPLKTARYGPAKVTPAFGSKPAQVTPGWMFLAPEANGSAATEVGSGGGSALDSAGGNSAGAHP
jgi:hypothetical protein